ncbi:MAG: 2Fe-2S iron-sulfur cluster binding domain-containing protein, partial [Desulfarculus sp.]|nr:2Fe-2S iron-sulfur cluster binding domain-containing protein [Desulfarculus sp.]
MPDPPDCGLGSPPAAVVFQPLGRRVAAAPGHTLLDLARAAGVALAGPCGGQGLCGKCQVRLDLPDPPPPQPGEAAALGQAVEQGFRLACQTSLPQGGSVWVPFRSRQGRQVILTQGAGAPVELDPAVRCLDLTVPPPSLESPTDQGQRLLRELGPHLAGSGAELPLGVLRGLPSALAEQGGRVAAALWQGRRVLDVCPGQGQPCLGLAVDLGTTTVVAYLADL